MSPHRTNVVVSPCSLRVQVRLGRMSGLLDALMLQFPMPPPALFAANDIDKCEPAGAQVAFAYHGGNAFCFPPYPSLHDMIPGLRPHCTSA